MNNNITVGLYTLGCRVNLYETCAIAERLSKLGYCVNKNDKNDFYVVNTCAVTAESERKSRQLVRRCAKFGKVLVIGCAAQLNNTFADIENVIYVGGNRNKMKVVDIINNSNDYCNDDAFSIYDAPYENVCLTGKGNYFSECRAFIKIEDGCNGKCTYCIIPKCRGKVRSRDVDDILNEAKCLVDNGFHEIILTGIEVSAYNKIPLYELIKRVGMIPGVRRLRLGSLSPNIISEKFLKEVTCIKTFMPHIHLSLQSCCDSVLKSMGRPYSKADIISRVALIKKYIPGCMISADIIVGFPGESEDDFLETLNTLKDLGVFHVHSFPYSERSGTIAAEMKNSVPKNIRNDRNAHLIYECNKIKTNILDSKIGTRLSVLIEKINNGIASGHTEEFLEASFACDNNAIGDIIEIEANSHNGVALFGDANKKGD